MNKTGLMAKISIKYVLPTSIWKYFRRISRYFAFFWEFRRISRKYLNFAGPRPREISEALKLPICSEIYNSTFTQIKFPLFIITIILICIFIWYRFNKCSIIIIFFFNIELLVNINQDTKYLVVFHCTFCNDLFNKLLAGFCNKCT